MFLPTGMITVTTATRSRRNHEDIVLAALEKRSDERSRYLKADVPYALGEWVLRRHVNVTAHPTAEWTTQQFREVFADVHPYRFVIHDHDSIFSPSLDLTLNDFGVRVLRTPVQQPTANAFCERLVGTIRRECLDYLIPLNERHLRLTLKEFVAYYNRARPHSALGPGTPGPILASIPTSGHRHHLPLGNRIRSKSVLGGLHHDYRLETEAA